MAELVDAPDSKSGTGNGVRVRVPPPAFNLYVYMSSRYSIKEIYYTLQGEGIQAGSPAVFLRFSGCNLWNGKEDDRESSVCTFCDTDFIGTNGPGGGVFKSPEELAIAVATFWPVNMECNRLVVCTGGEPLLQLDTPLIEALHQHGFRIAIETNGSLPVPLNIDWVTVSPKSKDRFVQKSGDEFKLVFPSNIHPDEVDNLDFRHFLLSPKWVDDSIERSEFLNRAIRYCKDNPKWRLSVQQHKYWDIP
jgi:7-carboxy-7-deazaguanine synthase